MNLSKLQLRGVVCLLLVSVPYSGISFADDVSVNEGLKQAKALFAQRSATDPKPIDKLIQEVLPRLEGQADDADLNFDVLILEARALYWKGEHANTSAEKISLHQQGQDKANAAKEINDSYADSYYFFGINIARWAEAKGIFESINRKGELIDAMNAAMERNTREGISGEDIDGSGPNRVFGRMYFKLPGILGGSHSKSVDYFKKAISSSESVGYKVPLNIVYYAETLSTGNSSEKALARQLLDELLKSDPNSYNPHRVPESTEEFELARKLRSQI